MPDDQALWRQIYESKQVQLGVRTIVFDSTGRKILVERNLGAREKYVNFPGGVLELGETLEQCISREMIEEIAIPILNFKILFLVENFILFEGAYLHGIEFYCEVKLGSDDVVAQIEGYEFYWLSVDLLSDVDLRPIIVRDRIIDGSYREVRHLISRD
jgi:8-oxo-dGTP pyrophosphatase MutT (NUDIX family)